jgi:putative N-acetyltransferase (TIGR04045 family)
VIGRPSVETVLWDLGGPRPVRGQESAGALLIAEARDPVVVHVYRTLRHRVFVEEQGLFPGSDHDDVDDDPRTIVLVAQTASGEVVGGVRLAPAVDGSDRIGWWAGSRLVAAPGAPLRTGATLVRAACARAEAEGALRFDALVQADKQRFFARLGWEARPSRDRRGRLEGAGSGATVDLGGAPHVRMRWPIGTLAAAARAKRVIGDVLGGQRPGGPGFVGDDGAPVPGSDLVAATDAVLPSMVERDPWWAGWCSVLVNGNDLAAMGAAPVGLLDALAAPTRSLARRVMGGLVAAAASYGVPVLGGHTQVGVPAALSVTMLGRTAMPVPGGGGRPGDPVSVVADLAGGWRRGYGGQQWDSTTARSPGDLRRMIATLQRARPHAAKDVSMAGLAGTLAMLAEASGCGAELDMAALPRPPGAGMADWLTCFPGFALVVAGPVPDVSTAAPATVARCGRLVAGTGVYLRWPDGELTPAVDGPVVGLGPASGARPGGPR